MRDINSFNPISTENNPLGALKVPKPIDVSQLQSTATTVFTARNDADFQIEGLTASNVTGVDSWVTVHLVPSGDSASAANTIAYQVVIPANDGVNIFTKENQGLLQPGSSLVALCDVNDSVNVYGYGFDYQGIY